MSTSTHQISRVENLEKALIRGTEAGWRWCWWCVDADRDDDDHTPNLSGKTELLGIHHHVWQSLQSKQDFVGLQVVNAQIHGRI